MFAIIETNGANRIVICVPLDGVDKSLPSLSRMLSENAVFVNVGYSNSQLVTPRMSIELGKEYRIENGAESIVIAPDPADCVISEEFVHATPEVLTSNRKQVAAMEAKHEQQRTEINFLKQQVSTLQAALDAATSVDSCDA